jgi:hypothetical protein
VRSRRQVSGARSSSMSASFRVRPSAACDVSFPLRVGLDGHPLYAVFRAVVTKDRAGGQVFATGSAFETRVIQDRAHRLSVRERRFALHEHREDIAVRRICDATRVRSYVTLSSTARQP